MKLILRQYLSDLRERNELDAILPDLLSELGFTVISRPSRGARQHGVDVAAIGPDDDDGGRQKLFLFTIKAGDLTRREWDDGTPQAVRQSLNEILDSYIRTSIPEQFQNLDIAICVCIGGEIRENVRTQWTGYVESHSTRRICFREWNGDKLAGLLLTGLLKQELLEPVFQRHFQKSVAMVEYPDVSYRFFSLLVKGLLEDSAKGSRRVTRLRQVYVCLWVLFVWARDSGNLEAPFRASEYAILQIWNHCRKTLNKQTTDRDLYFTILDQSIKLHFLISGDFLTIKLGAYVGKPFALSLAVRSHSAVDVNLALFEQLGRCSLYGLWQHWMASRESDRDVARDLFHQRDQTLRMAIEMINANPVLHSPIRDDFAIEVSLFMMLAQVCGAVGAVSGYVGQMALRLRTSIELRTAYPTPTTAYHELVDHPIDRSDGYFERSTRASVLYPLLISWLDKLDLKDIRDDLQSCIKSNLSHTTQQVWVPGKTTDENLWSGSTDHGVAIPGLPICKDSTSYAAILNRIITDHTSFNGLSTTRSGYWPVFLAACRHFRLPVPPHLWFTMTDDDGSKNEVCQADKAPRDAASHGPEP